jgi:SAM-dependent methyltransferase
LCGDALSYPLADAGFDAVVSFLAMEHIPDRLRLCARLAPALRSGGACFIEDLYMRAPFADSDLHDLREVLFCLSLTSIDDYVADLRAAGFKDILATDLTSDWAPYAHTRLATWRENHASYAAAHGEGGVYRTGKVLRGDCAFL